jgi:peptidase C25-like protein
LTFADGHGSMNREFYRQVFGMGLRSARLGDAVMRAKAATFDADVRRTWILFADPTMRVR